MAGMWLKLRTAVRTNLPALTQSINSSYIEQQQQQQQQEQVQQEQEQQRQQQQQQQAPDPEQRDAAIVPPPPSSLHDLEEGTRPQARAHDRAVGSGSPASHPEGNDGKRPACDDLEKLRRRVTFFFMDPWSKFKASQGCYIPFKLIVQVFKIGLITAQMVEFGQQRSEIVEFFDRTERTLDHLLLKGWEASYETMPYPPATGPFALYTQQDLLDHLQHTWTQYYSLSNISLASINPVTDKSTGRPLPLRLCARLNNYTDFHNGSYVVWPGVESYCKDLVPLEGSDEFNIRVFLRKENLTITFQKLLELTMSFTLTTFHLNLAETHNGPACFTVSATIVYRNYKRSGQLQVNLETQHRERECTGSILSDAVREEEKSATQSSITLDSFVIVFCLASMGLCVRSLIVAITLLRRVERQFKRLGWGDRRQFINLWYVLILTNDVCTISAAVIKILLETRAIDSTSHNYNTCSMLLGLGGLMAWIGVLRYLEFSRKTSVLLLTLKAAFVNVLRFLLCAFAMFLGFLFCGWLVLGPYHLKFRQLDTATECLYSLIHGDDMFVTFTAAMTVDRRIWLFSRFYLYAFISLYILCVLSLFISVFTETYEKLKTHFTEGFPKTELHRFLEQPPYECDDFSCTQCVASRCQRCKCNCKPQPEEAAESRI